MAPWSLFKKNNSDKTKPSNVLDNGWQFYAKPNNIERPGTIFRITKENIRYIVTHLDLEMQEGQEAFGKSTEKMEVNVGFFAQMLGLSKANLQLTTKLTRNCYLEFELWNASREITTDESVQRVLHRYLKKMDYKADQRYFITREARKGTGIVYKLSKDLAGQLGGEIDIAKALSLNGNFARISKGNVFELVNEFATPLRVMFLAEEIKPLSLNFSGDHAPLGLVPLKEPLYWESTADAQG